MRLRWTARPRVETLEARETPATLYVAPNGVDTHSGAANSPLQTLQAAANRVSAGDTVIVEAGTYRGFNLTTSGTASARITFEADPSLSPGSVIINQPNGWNNLDGINLEALSYVTVEGFTVTGQPRAGIRSVTNQFVVIRDNVADSNTVWASSRASVPMSRSSTTRHHGRNSNTASTFPTVPTGRWFAAIPSSRTTAVAFS